MYDSMLPPKAALSHSLPAFNSSKVRGNDGGGVSVSLFIRHFPSAIPHLGSAAALSSAKDIATPVEEVVVVVVTVVVTPLTVVVVVVVVVVVDILGAAGKLERLC